MRILFVAMADSVHTARWISQLNGKGWDIHLFPVEDVHGRGMHPSLRDLTVHDVLYGKPPGLDNSVRVLDDYWPFLKNGWPLPRGKHRARRLLQRWMPSWKERAWRLAQTIRKLQPDIVHSLEMQHAGYLMLDSLRELGKRPVPPWIYSCWGSDIFFFGKQPEHQRCIRAVLEACDYFTADCQRDVQLAREFGFRGEALGVFPGPGGFDVQRMQELRQPGPVSSRKVIALKGNHDDDWAGRALVALQGLHLCADLLTDYEIIVYYTTPNVVHAADYVARMTGLRFTILPQSPNETILDVMGRARLAIGVNVTDGTPNSMLEAMVMGAFPIQSDTISTGEWIRDGDNGFLVPPEDPQAVAVAVRRALTDDALVDRAAEINTQMMAERIDRSLVQPQVIAMYEKVAAQSSLKGRNLA